MAKRLALLALLAAGALAGCGSQATHLTSTRPAVPEAPTVPRAASMTPAAPTTPNKARPAPEHRPNACAGNAASQLVLVSITHQHVWMCSRTHLAYSAPVTTGAVDLPYDSTPTGTYAVQAKQTDQTLTLLSGATYQVNYWIPFDGPLFGFHDSSWQSFPYGSARYHTEGSHGCVHMPLAAIRFLYNWAVVGATVTIRA
jgi:lipoprotein-anchoring transpeptidase ErfK/SrfK